MAVGRDDGPCLHVVEVDIVALVLVVVLFIIVVIGQVIALQDLGEGQFEVIHFGH